MTPNPSVSRLPQGFAAAVMPVTASAITTNINGLTAGEVEIPSGDIRMPAYRAKPESGASFPTVIVVQEIFGIHEHIKDLCRRLAKEGYLAVAPYLYEREGEVAHLTEIEEIRKVVGKVPDAQVMRDLDATADWAAKDGGDTNRLAVTGFCWGGRIVWLYSAHTNRFKAGAAWYGRLAGPRTELQAKNPVDIAKVLKVPVRGFYGGKDAGIPLDTVEQMRLAIEAAHKPSRLDVYPEAQHGFNADYRPAYDPEAARDAWSKMLQFFKEHNV
ncbi:MAG TPA: dienelactone hydrolase family protein [Bryobacteraceae bacterium]|jgi:carboxymethylenebutenolidase|nr:dienelactone hydrolase family protein [Bryobacteraceae bacterium]